MDTSAFAVGRAPSSTCSLLIRHLLVPPPPPPPPSSPSPCLLHGEAGYATAFEAFTEVLASRKEGLGGGGWGVWVSRDKTEQFF